MTTLLHALEVDREKCTGKLACMRVCPTDAIRIRNGKVEINEILCIDCGECIVACPEGAIRARTDCWDDVESFKFKVAITTPTLYGQFPMAVSPADIVEGLLSIGFDAVYETSMEVELINRAIQEYLDEYDGPLPLISSTCPVVVRLIQVAYPDMVGQLMPFEPPRELAGREMKRLYSEKLGIPKSQIGAIYISPCPAKMVSIKQPAESVMSYIRLGEGAGEGVNIGGIKSYLDRAIGIRDIYNPLLAAITRLTSSRKGTPSARVDSTIKSADSLRLAMTGGQSHALKHTRYISVSQLPNIIKVIEDIDKGKIKHIEFLECYACTGGCIGGALTVDERFVARSKIQKLIDTLEKEGPGIKEQVQEKYVKGDYFLRQPCVMRPTESRPVNFMEQIRRMKVKEKYVDILPSVNCGLCGAPRCEVFADDLAKGLAKVTDCPLLSADRIREIRETYGLPDSDFPVEEDDKDCGD